MAALLRQGSTPVTEFVAYSDTLCSLTLHDVQLLGRHS